MSIQLAFYFDQSRCMSCNACTVACKDWNQIEPGLVNWRSQFTHEVNGGFFPLSMGCNHCKEPACMKACAYNAISKSDDGIVTVDRAKCKSLKSCITACPFTKPMLADDKQEPNPLLGWQIVHPMQKCTMCKDRLDQGLKPACVSACVGRALDFGTIDSLKAKYPDAVLLNRADFPYAFTGAGETGPSLLIKKRSAITIHKSTNYNGK